MTEAERLAQWVESSASENANNSLIAAELRRQAAEIELLRVDAECFQFWVHEAWHSPGDICRLLMDCETPADYRAKLVPIMEGRRAAINTAKATHE